MSVEGISTTTQYLSFRLDEEEFALDISKVREVLDITRITRVPQTPGFLRGVINLRGSWSPWSTSRKSRPRGHHQVGQHPLIICELQIEEDVAIVGALADSVHEVMEIERRTSSPHQDRHQAQHGFLKGMGKRDEEFILIPTSTRSFREEISIVSQAGKTTGP
jgi:purine-binding chemotaxis protein CheW